MISGRVESSLDPVVELTIRGSSGRNRSIAFVVDTGYNGALSLTQSIIDHLQLTWSTWNRSVLADGKEITHDVFDGHVIWDGKLVPVFVDSAETAPLIGTALLRGYELTAQMRPHGKLTLKKLPPKRKKRT